MLPSVFFPHQRGSRLVPLLAWTAVVVVLMLLAWLIVAVKLVAYPEQGPLKKADAIVMLGGASSERLPVALKLAEQQWAPTLVLSNTHSVGNASADDVCANPATVDVRVVCFQPETLNTRGEAAAIGKLAATNGWKSIIVVTSRYHLTRAETLVAQCTSATLDMEASEPHISDLQWLRRLVIETAGLLDAKLDPECKAAP